MVINMSNGLLRIKKTRLKTCYRNLLHSGIYIFISFILSSNLYITSAQQNISPFGMGIYPTWYPPQELPKVLERAESAGIKWTRMNFRPQVEPQKGKFNWRYYDMVVDTVMQHGIKVMGLIDHQPEWISKNQPSTDEQREKFGSYVYDIVKHFKNRITYWEFWNEPGGGADNWSPQPNAVAYTKLLKVAYTEAKKADPKCVILAPGGASKGFIKAMLENGAYNYFDILSEHPYPTHVWATPSDVGLVYRIRGWEELLKQYGGPKPVWFSEIGYTTRIGGVDASTKAFNLVRAYIQSLALGVKNIMFFDFVNSDVDIRIHNNSGWGIINSSLLPTSPYNAYKTMTQLLSKARFEKSIFGNEGKTRAILFDKKAEKVLVVWSAKGLVPVKLKIGVNKVKVHDIYGNQYILKCPGKVLSLKASPMPVYISGFTDIPKKIGKSTPAYVPSKWLICGPFNLSGNIVINKSNIKEMWTDKKKEGYAKSLLSMDYLKNEGGEASIRPKAGDIVINKYLKGGQTKWKYYPADIGEENLMNIYHTNQHAITNQAAYAYCKINSTENRLAIFDIQSQDGNKVWVNHKLVQEQIGDGEHLLNVKLHKGENNILIKTYIGGGVWNFSLRVLGN